MSLSPQGKWKELTLVSNIVLCPLRPAECPIIVANINPFWAVSLRTSKDMLQADTKFESSNCVVTQTLAVRVNLPQSVGKFEVTQCFARCAA